MPDAARVQVEQQLVLTRMKASLAQVNVSPGGMPKLPVDAARVTKHGLEGDVQRNKKYHGGPNRAVNSARTGPPRSRTRAGPSPSRTGSGAGLN